MLKAPIEVDEVVQAELVSAIRESKSPVFLFDYDGTLKPFVTVPKDAEPDAKLLELLSRLSRLFPNGRVVIVSGRAHGELGKWFAQCESIYLSGDHGAYYSPVQKQGGREWRPLVKGPAQEDFEAFQKWACDWISDALSEIGGSSDLEEGILLSEVKVFSVGFNFRTWMKAFSLSEAEALPIIEKLVVEFNKAVRSYSNVSVFETYKYELVYGDFDAEWRSPMHHKGIVVEQLLDKWSGVDCVLCVGDSGTDEDMFDAVSLWSSGSGKKAFTMKVGNKDTVAKYRIPGVTEVLGMIADMVSVSPPQLLVEGTENKKSGAGL